MWKPREKRRNLLELCELRESARAAGQVVVWSNGTFDLMHPGHVRSLEQARALGDLLFVGINSDRSVRAYKGPDRPILSEQERAALVAGLECVDSVLIFDEETPVEVLRLLRPDIHCKGAEYAPPHGRPVPERAIIEAYGGRIEYLPLIPGISTTDLIHRVLQRCTPSRFNPAVDVEAA
jgi:D-beta-D-heptose 7-phosphate kinase/D-beta-D-heptose 1-phosphate adenosyltransferase